MPPPFHTFLTLEQEKPEAKPLGAHIHQDNRPLPAISESFEAQPPSLFTWTLQHTSQIIELTLRILFTKQNKTALELVDSLKAAETKFKNLIELYKSEICTFKFQEMSSK